MGQQGGQCSVLFGLLESWAHQLMDGSDDAAHVRRKEVAR